MLLTDVVFGKQEDKLLLLNKYLHNLVLVIILSFLSATPGTYTIDYFVVFINISFTVMKKTTQTTHLLRILIVNVHVNIFIIYFAFSWHRQSAAAHSPWCEQHRDNWTTRSPAYRPTTLFQPSTGRPTRRPDESHGHKQLLATTTPSSQSQLKPKKHKNGIHSYLSNHTVSYVCEYVL